MDQEVILEKLEALRRCVRRVESKRPEKAETFASDWDLQDIVTLNLTRGAVQVSVDIATYLISGSEQSAPDSMGAAFDRLVTIKDFPPNCTTGSRKKQNTTIAP